MSEKEETEEAKPSIEDLYMKIKDVRKLAEDSKVTMEKRMKSRPLESAAMIFLVGLILGIIIGSTRRH